MAERSKNIVLFSLVVLIIPLLWYARIPLGNALGKEEVAAIDSISLRQKILSPYVPEKVIFAGEEVPVWIPEVKERLENELVINSHWHSNTIMMMKMAPRWFPMFEKVFKDMGVPDDFKYVSLIESRLKNEDSPAGAAGFWHIMPATAKDYGLYMDEEVDERYDPELATEVAAKFFLEAKERFGSWVNAAACYNRGMAGYARAIKHQQVSNYYDLKMNPETARYVFRIIAVKMIMENPERYGFYLSEKDLYKPLDTYEVTIDSTVSDWADFAKENGTIYKYVRLYNPWIQEKYLNNKKRRSYQVKLPKKSAIYGDRDVETGIIDTGLDSTETDAFEKQE
jgi:hypothetical protein